MRSKVDETLVIVETLICPLQIFNQIFIVTRRISTKRETSGGVHLCSIAPGQHSSEKTTLRCRAVGDAVSGLLDRPRIKPKTCRVDSEQPLHRQAGT